MPTLGVCVAMRRCVVGARHLAVVARGSLDVNLQGIIRDIHMKNGVVMRGENGVRD